MHISDKGLDLIKRFEGFRDTAYLCPAGVWTIGYGHTHDVKEGDTISQDKAEELLREEVAAKYEPIVAANTDSLELTQGQFDALVSFVYNVGAYNFETSHLLTHLKAGDIEGAAAQFERWNRAGGKVLDGLTARRAAERELFLS